MKKIAYASSRPITRGWANPLKISFAPPENVLDIVKKFGPLSENSSPTLVSQAGYGPGFKIFSDYAPVFDAYFSPLIQFVRCLPNALLTFLKNVTIFCQKEKN